MWIIIARILLSWAVSFGSIDPYHPAVQFLSQITDPILEPVRNAIPPMGGFDLSPIVVLIGLQVLIAILAG
jgi:YggT family protein